MTCCGLTKYGLREVAASTVVLFSLVWLALWLLPPLAAVPIACLPAAVWLWVLWFFRDPDRQAPAEEGLFVSPADGRVTDITPLGPESLLGCPGVQVGIFMSVFDVHVNRSSADAVVRRIEHRPGKYLDVRDRAGWEQNESATLWLTHRRDGKMYPLVLRQIAGLIARRIVTDIREGQILSRGQRIGMIKFGSRMELLVPQELVGTICVKVGQKVHAGLTVLIQAPIEGSRGQDALAAPPGQEVPPGL